MRRCEVMWCGLVAGMVAGVCAGLRGAPATLPGRAVVAVTTTAAAGTMAAAAGTGVGTGVAAVTEIAGTLETKDGVVRVAAIDRGFADVLKTSQAECRDKFVYEGTFDAKTKKFVIPKLLAGRSYDLVIWTEDGGHVRTRWEGVSMAYHRAVLPATGVDGLPAAATGEDRKWLEDFVKEMPAFYDKARVLHMAADHKHAVLLVELARTRDFHSDKGGEVIYRVELWYFENLFGGWAKDKNTEKVMVRWRGEGGKLEKRWQFLPALGGVVANGEAVVVKLPAKASEGEGRD